jgi:hypothetical protein
MALQHLRSGTANKRPTPAAMADGQLAAVRMTRQTQVKPPICHLLDGGRLVEKIG